MSKKLIKDLARKSQKIEELENGSMVVKNSFKDAIDLLTAFKGQEELCPGVLALPLYILNVKILKEIDVLLAANYDTLQTTLITEAKAIATELISRGVSVPENTSKKGS